MIIGITGTLCAGKGTVVEYLEKEKGFKHFSVSRYLTDELEKRGTPVNLDTLISIGNEIRATHSPSFIAEELAKEALSYKGNCVIESLRCEAEINVVRGICKGVILAVDADIEKRHKRSLLRKGEKDNLSFDEFVKREEKQWQSTDPNKQNLKRCIEMADYKIMNDGTKKELHLAIEQVFSNISLLEKPSTIRERGN